MLAENKCRQILQLLDSKAFVTIDEFAKELNVSDSSARRYLSALDEEGKLKRVHGGAISLTTQYESVDREVSERRLNNIEAKKEISKYAASLIEDEDFIYIDSGTTTEFISDYLTAKNVTLVTNNIYIAKTYYKKYLKVFLIGGEYKAVTEANIGPNAVDNLKQFNFNKGFFGANGVDFKLGFTTPDMEEAAVKMQAFEKSIHRYVLADNSKIGKITSFTFGEIDDATLITNSLQETHITKNLDVVDVDKIYKAGIVYGTENRD